MTINLGTQSTMSNTLYHKRDEQIESLVRKIHPTMMRIIGPFYAIYPAVISFVKYILTGFSNESLQPIYPAT